MEMTLHYNELLSADLYIKSRITSRSLSDYSAHQIYAVRNLRIPHPDGGISNSDWFVNFVLVV